MISRRRSCLASWLALFCVVLMLQGAQAADQSRLAFVTKTGTHVFRIEVAKSDAERAKGLMFRRSLDPDAGMLFDFGKDSELSMWMKNTYIPLDMVFLRADGTVLRIARDTTPFSTDPIPSGGPARAVVELNGGTAQRIGLAPGDKTLHPAFGTSP